MGIHGMDHAGTVPDFVALKAAKSLPTPCHWTNRGIFVRHHPAFALRLVSDHAVAASTLDPIDHSWLSFPELSIPGVMDPFGGVVDFGGHLSHRVVQLLHSIEANPRSAPSDRSVIRTFGPPNFL